MLTEINKPVTFLVGANGYGKSTTLLSMYRKTRDDNSNKVVSFDIFDNAHYIKNQLSKSSYPYTVPDKVVIMLDAYSGETYHTLLSEASISLSTIMKTSEAYHKIILLKQLQKQLDLIYSHDFSGEVLVYLDGIDSGATLDVAEHLSTIINEIIHNDKVKIISTANNFEFMRPDNYNCEVEHIDARTTEPVTVHTYEEYREHILQTSVLESLIDSL